MPQWGSLFVLLECLGETNEKAAVSGAFLLWARLGSNQRPLACEASALPLSYAP
jgi:hypothetical protein